MFATLYAKATFRRAIGIEKLPSVFNSPQKTNKQTKKPQSKQTNKQKTKQNKTKTKTKTNKQINQEKKLSHKMYRITSLCLKSDYVFQ